MKKIQLTLTEDQPIKLHSGKLEEIHLTLKNIQAEGIKALQTNKANVVRDRDKSTATNLTLKSKQAEEIKRSLLISLLRQQLLLNVAKHETDSINL